MKNVIWKMENAFHLRFYLHFYNHKSLSPRQSIEQNRHLNGRT